MAIEMPSDDILLGIFRHYLDATPRSWPMLGWVCQRWRHIVFTSPLSLNLRLYCTYGTPIIKSLDCWPASLPIVIQYGGFPNLDPPSPEDEENIIAALKQSSRPTTINLTVTKSLLENLSAISDPFSELEELVLLSKDNTQLALPSSFRWGARLRTLHLTRVAIPALPRLLSPLTGLVDLLLDKIPKVGYFPPEAFANALSGMTHLRTLSLHFLSSLPRREYILQPPPSEERVVLPSLTCLIYRGTSKYLDSLVARIDASHLEDIDITLFSQPTMDASQLGQFIERIEMQTSLSQADVEISGQAISICFSKPGSLSQLYLKISCKQLDWQLFSMSQICHHFSSLFRVEDLGIYVTQCPTGLDDMNEERWLELIRRFDDANEFRVAGKLATDILCALGRAKGEHPTDTTVLPALRNLRIQEPMPLNGPLWNAAKLFITLRRLSGRPVEGYVSQFLCHICNSTSFEEQQVLKAHLVDIHACRIMCTYCGNFEFRPACSALFLEHLESRHPSEAAHVDTLTLNPALQIFPPADVFEPPAEPEALDAPLPDFEDFQI